MPDRFVGPLDRPTLACRPSPGANRGYARVRTLPERGRAAGEFRDDVPLEWQVNVVQAIIHSASVAVHRGEITDDAAPSLVRDTTLAALSA